MKNKIKRLFSSKKNIAIAISALLIFAMATSATFAWFKNIFSVQGVEMNTGMFEYQFLGYSSADMTPDFKYSTNSQDSGFKYIGDVEGVTATRDVTNMQQISSEEPGVLYYVVRKTEGSIDLDVALKFDADFSKLVRFSEVLTGDESGSTNLSTESATESLGSFWYSISSVKGGGTQFSDLSSIENYIKADSTKFTSLIPTADGKNRYFPDIRNEIINESLGKDDTFVCFRIEYGISGATPANTGITMPLGVTLHVAQKGGIGEYTGKTHIVTTLDELNTALSTYRPHDTVVIAGDIEYKGNLNIDNILNIVIENGSLTVKGNMRYTYAGVPDDVGADTEDNYKPAQTKFEIRVKSGYLKILQMDAADLGEGVTDVGGNLYFDIPNSTMTISGRNDTGAGNADIYIQNDFHVNTDYANKGESPVGLILSNVSVRDLDDSAVNMYLHEDTQLTVGQDVSLGTVKAIHSFYDPTSSLRLHVQNYGIINHINFEDMSFINIADPMPYTPRILIDNYGVITNPIRVASFSRPFDPEKEWDMSDPNDRVTATQYNTRVIWEQGAGKMSIDNYNQSNFRTEHIERILKTTLIDKVNGDDTNIVIHYMDNDNVSNTTIASLLEYYQIGAGAEGDLKIAATKDIKSLKIICYTGYYLTEADYNTIRQMESVETIDLSEAVSALDESKTGGVLPDGAFMGLTQLKNLTLSSKDVKWGANLFQGTQIDEIELPSRLATLHRDALNGIIYLHMGNKAGLVYETEFMSRVMARNAYIFGTDAARNELISLIEGADETTVGTYKERTEGVPTTTQLNKIANIRLEAQRYGDYYLALYNDSCKLIAYIPEDGKTFSAANEENNQSEKHADGNLYRFNFNEFEIIEYDANGNVISDNTYDIIEYDDFAFYQINVSGNGDTLTFNEKLNAIGDAAFYNATLPTNVDLGGCKTLGHASLATNSKLKNIAGLKVETAGFYACGGYNPRFINMPRLTKVYGLTFGVSTRMDIGLVQMASDAISKNAKNSQLTTGSNIFYTAVVVHTEYVSEVPIALVKLGDQSSSLVFAPEEYRSLLVSASFCASSAFDSLGTHTAAELGFLTFMGEDVTDNIFAPGDYLYNLNADSSAYTLLSCIHNASVALDGSLYSKDGVFTIPAYKDDQGRTTISTGGIFGYHTINNVQTLTFADDYRTIGGSFFGGTSYAYRKYVAHIDFNKVETIGSSAFYLSNSLISVSGENVKSIGASAFEQCSELRTVTLPNVTFGANSKAFLGCSKLHTAVIGPQYAASDIFRNCTKLDTVYINMTNLDPDKKKDYIYLQGGKNSIANSDLNVIAIGHELTWEKSANSPCWNIDSNPDNDIIKPYSLVTVDADISTIIFADWTDGDPVTVQLANSTDSKYAYTYTFSTPTYMFSEDQDGLTIQLSFGLGDITGETYVVPNTLYKGFEKIETILGNETDKYFTTNVEGTTSTGKNVVGIEDNIFTGKITVNTIQFPTGLKTIGKNSFANCTFRNGISITGAESGLVIEDGAFSGVTTSSLTISNATEIGVEAFKGITDKDEYGASQAMSSIQLGSKLSSIGESAFEGANAASVTTTHDNANPIILTIGENAFKNLKNGTGGEVAVNFSGAVADFGANSFYNVKLSNLTAPNTILIRANAFYMADITGTADFSQGVPAEMVAAHGNQTIEPYGFRGTSGDKNQLGTIKLGADAVLKGNYTSKVAGEQPIKEANLQYIGAFTDCEIGEFYFNSISAIDPESLAFVGCSFEKIDLGAMTTLGTNLSGVGGIEHSSLSDAWTISDKNGNVKSNLTYTRYVFRNCTDLGEVYFTNVTELGPISYPQSTSARTKIKLCDFEKVNNIKAYAFYYMDVTGDLIFAAESTPARLAVANSILRGNVTFRENIVSTSGGSGVLHSSTLHGNLIFESGVSLGSQNITNTTINGNVEFKTGSVPCYEGIRDCTINGDLYLHDGIVIKTTWTFNRTNITGTVYIGQITISGTGNFLFGIGTTTYWSNAYKTINKISFMDSCTEVPSRIAALVYINEIDFNNAKKVGDYAFSNSVIGTIKNMDSIEEFGKYSFGNYRSTADSSTVKLTSINTGLDISGAKVIGEGAFSGLVFKTSQSLSAISTIELNAFKSCTFEQPLTVGSALGTNILDSAFEGAKFNSSIDLAGVKTVGASAFKSAIFTQTLQLKDITSFGEYAFTGAVVNGDLIFGTRSSDGADGYIYSGPASAIGANAFGSLTTYDTDNTTVLSYLPGITVTGEVNFVNVKGIDTNGFRNAILQSPITFGSNIGIGDSAFYGVTVPAVTFVGSPTIQPNAFKQSKITTLTFQNSGEILAEAFAEGTFDTINLGSVASLGGSYTPATDTEAAQVTGAFRSASIGTINFQNSCVPTESIPMPIAVKAFADATINFLNFGGDWTENAQGKLEQSISTSKALVGDVAENVTDATYKAGAYSPFSGAKIERLNLNGVTSIGYGYFANMEVGQVDTITSETIELQAWSLSSTTIKTGSMVFTGDVTMRGFATCGQLKIPNGNLEFNGSLVAAGGKNQVNITGNMIINNLSGTGEGNTDNVFLGSIATGYTYLSSTISGDLIFRNTETIACGFRNLTIGGLIFENVEKATQLRGFSNIVIKNRIDFNCLQQVGGRTFGGVTFPNNTVLNLTNLTSTGNHTFNGAKKIVTVNAPNLTSIGESAFANVTSIVTVNAPKLIRVLQSAFSSCTSLKRIELPSLQKIGQWAFSGCSKLEEVVIGDQFNQWGVDANGAVPAFERCTSLKRVILKAPLYESDSTTLRITGVVAFPAGAKLLVPHALFADYQDFFTSNPGTKLWFRSTSSSSGITLDRIDTIQFILSDGTGVTYLAELLYGNKIEIVDIIDAANVLSNASYTFPSTLVDGDTTYTVVSIAGTAMKKIPSNVTTIGLPSTLEYINFSGIDLHINVQAYSIENNSLYQAIDGVLYTADSKTLVMYPTGRSADIVVPATVERIGEYAFAGNQGVGTITFMGNVTISDGAFANCYGLNKIAFQAVMVDGTASAPVVRFTGRNTVSGCMLTGDDSLKIQVCGTAYPEVLYDTQLYSLFELTAVPAAPTPDPAQNNDAGVQNAGGENVENGSTVESGATESTETPAV